jgi:hypothetical protein
MSKNTVRSLIAAHMYIDSHIPAGPPSPPQPETKTKCEVARKRQGSLVAFTMAGAMAMALTGCDDAQQPAGTYIAPPKGLTPNDAAVMTTYDAATTNAYIHPTSPGAGVYWTSRGYYPVYAQPGYYYRPAPGTTAQIMTVSESFASGEGDDGISRGGFGGGEGEGGGGE